MEKYVGDDFKPKKLDINNLLTKALNNETNESIMKLDRSKISKYKNDILQKLQLDRKKLKLYAKKLKNYRYVSDLSDLNYGSYIRWINLSNIEDIEDIKITNGGVLLDIKMTNNGILILCKNFRNIIFQIKFDECLIFQKLTNQEEILLRVIDYINN
jgi:hypothetical protein